MFTHLWSAGASTLFAVDAGASLKPQCGLLKDHEVDLKVALRPRGEGRLWSQHASSPLPVRIKLFSNDPYWDPELIRKTEHARKIFLRA